ncbi:hypothetical protein D9M68_837860 [compost metagenome]
MVAGVAAGLDADAALQALFTQVGAPGPGRDHQVDGVALGADAQLLVADPGQRADVAALQLVFAHHGFLGFVHFFFGERQFHAQDLGAVEQALGVFFQAEDRRAARRVVGTNAFEGAAAVVQRVGQHMDLGVAPVDHLAVHPDLAVAVGHRGNDGAHGGPLDCS